jgi:uncharacterized protein
MKLLSLDGGGVFGFPQAEILARSQAAEKFDAFVGTSIGSVVAAIYALQPHAHIGYDFFEEYMPKIFRKNFFRSINIFQPKYSDNQLNQILKTLFNSISLSNSPKPLYITAGNIQACRLKVFSSLDIDDGSQPVWVATRCSVAAPTYFSTYNGYCDGGVFVNNPAMVGVSSVINQQRGCWENIEVFSIGTGDRTGPVHNPITRLGWPIWLMSALLQGASNGMNDYYIRSLIASQQIKKYRRIQFTGYPSWKLDDIKSMRKARELWEPQIQNAIKEIKEF